MPSCVVRGCVCTRKKPDPSIILHCFPKEPEKIKLWLQQTEQYGSDIDKMVEKVYLGKVYDTYRMCSLHFTHDCYLYNGYRRSLKKDAVPTIFIKTESTDSLMSATLPSVSGPPTSSEQQIPSAYSADDQKPSDFCIKQEPEEDFPDIHWQASSQSSIQYMTYSVPKRVVFQQCEMSQKSNLVVVDRSIPVKPTSTTISVATQKHSALSDVSQPSSAPPTSKVSSSCVQQITCTISKFTASSHDEKQKQLTPDNLQKISPAPVTFLPKSASSVPTNSSLPLDTQLKPEATSPSIKTPSSCRVISLPPVSSPIIPTSGIAKSSYKTMSSPPSSMALAIVRETKPYWMTTLPVSVNVSSVKQMPPTTCSSSEKQPPIVHIPFKTSSSQTVISDSVPPSKKRKLEENVFLETSAASSYSLPSRCMSQTAANTGKPYLASNSASSCPSQKPLMVDKGVNTDFLTNRRSCCISTDHWHLRRNAQTQTKISTKHRKTMCTLLVPNCRTKRSKSTISRVSPEDVELNDYSPSSRSDSDNDPCDDFENLGTLDLVKVEVLSDSEMDSSVPAASGIEQGFHVKEENDSPARLLPIPFKSNITIPDFDTSTLEIKPIVKTEEDQFSIPSPSSQNITRFVSQNDKNETFSPIPCEPLASVYRSSPLWETSVIQTDDNEPEDSNVFSFLINELSEDEDESFLVSSDAEDEDDVKHVFQDLDSPVENPVEEEKYIVFESCLKQLIMMIPCRSETKCMSPLTQYRKETVGSYLSIEVCCSSGHTSLLWESQPRHVYEALGNVLLSAAVLFSGSSFVKSQQMFKLLNVKSIDKTTYSKHQSMYLFPTIHHHWREEQKAVLQNIQGRPLCLVGDQQLDNPGFSAKYSTYSLMDVNSKKICSFSVEPVTPQVKLEDLEKIGFQKAMGELQTMSADVKTIVSGRSVGIQEFLKDRYPHIIHHIDLWHLSKSITEEVLMAAKYKDCEILHEWAEAIRNHLWWSSCTCCKNYDLLIQKWKSVIQHVTNVHEWDGDSDCRACHHPPLPEDVVNSTNWLEKGSAAHKQLRNIVENHSLLEDLKQLSFHCHTGELDIYYRTCLKYRPKTSHFFMDSMVARTQLAALDHNRNVHTVKTVVKDAAGGDALGAMTQRLEVSKGQKSWIVKALYKPACQNFLFDIMNDVIGLVKEEKTF